MSYSTKVFEDSLQSLFLDIKLKRNEIMTKRSQRAADEETFTKRIFDLEQQLETMRTRKEIVMSRHDKQLAQLSTTQTGNLEKLRAIVNPNLANDIDTPTPTKNHPWVQPRSLSPPPLKGWYFNQSPPQYPNQTDASPSDSFSRAGTPKSTASNDAKPIASPFTRSYNTQFSFPKDWSPEASPIFKPIQCQQQPQHPKQTEPVSLPTLGMDYSNVSEHSSDVVVEPAVSPLLEARSSSTQMWSPPHVADVPSSGAKKSSGTCLQMPGMIDPGWLQDTWSVCDRPRGDVEDGSFQTKVNKLLAEKIHNNAAKKGKGVGRAQDDIYVADF
ncbi:hypothetical protein EV356DRAFT_574586 [Viridothelium virens]|uniref:Uncharacterized protein n=1 Tax=Viridothelium virens TaxID=1048519 RepID=A0A6A6HG11_VIRVR|nr:hypothetical protein EV356DRAFT_574586 [Viridothelium virens]